MNKGALELSENAPTLRSGAGVDNRYRVLCTLGLPSECAVTYLATDEVDQRPVVLKELFPRRFVARTLNGTSLRPHSSSDAAEFSRILRRFVRDGEVLAEVAHPNLVRTLRCVEANDTAYWVMEHCAGVSLFEYAALASEQGTPLPALEIGLAVLSALEAMHAESLVYRDVSPQRVLMQSDGNPLLLSPSSERYLAGSSRGPTAGFAALELYGSKEVGPWTDVYGCAGLLYFLLAGTAPPSAIERASTSSDLPLLGAERGVDSLLGTAIARGLALAPERRPHSVREFRRLLESGRATPGATRDGSGASSVARGLDSRRDHHDEQSEIESRLPPTLRLEGGVVLPGEGESVGNAVRRFALGLIRSPNTPERRDESAGVEAVRHDAPAPKREQPIAKRVGKPIVTERDHNPAPAVDPPEQVQEDPRTAALRALSEREPRERASTGLSPQALAALVGETHASHSRAPLVAAAVILLLAVTAGVVYATRQGDASVPAPIAPASAPAAATTPAVVAGSSVAIAQPTQDSSPVTRAPSRPPASQQADAANAVRRTDERVAERAAPPTPAAPAATVAAPSEEKPAPATPSGRLTAVSIAIPTVAADLRSLPSDIVVAIQNRAANGRESAEQGAYAGAHATFRTALKQLDSVATNFPRNVQLETLRRDITQMVEQTAQACRAENDVRQKRGGKPIPCS